MCGASTEYHYVKQIGKPSTLVSSHLTYAPNVGAGVREVIKGNKAAMQSLGVAYQRMGWATDVYNDGATWVCEATYGGNPQDANGTTIEQPVDRWEIDAEFYQASIWSNPVIYRRALKIFNASNPALDGTVNDVVATWKTFCNNALKGIAFDPNTGNSSVKSQTGALAPKDTGFIVNSPLYDIYCGIVEGQDAWEARRAVLTRTRTISTAYPTQFTIPPVEIVYSTPILVSMNSIPENIAVRLPGYPNGANLPPIPAMRYWGWKQRRETSQIVLAQNKVEEVTEWVFAAWSAVTYDVDTIKDNTSDNIDHDRYNLPS